MRGWGMVAASAVALAGCASPTGVLQLVDAKPPNASRVDILAVTTRAPSPDSGVLFSGERGDASLSSMVVSIPPDETRQIGRVQWPQRTPPDPASEFSLVSADRLSGKDQPRDWLRRHVSKSGRVLVFVHGFNQRFEEALFTFAQIAHDSGADAAPVLFSWPSRGSLFEYVYDRESANFSRDSLEWLLRQIADNPKVSEIVVLAHSMGAWVATEALRQMAIRDGRVSKKVSSVILASPDLDVDVFRAQWRSFGEKPPRFIVFVSRQDRALRLSRGIAGNIDRLGVIDASSEPWVEAKGVEVIDLTGVENDNLTRHSKFAEHPDVVRFLGTQLINGQTREAQTGFGERLGGVAMGLAQGATGSAALALTAPIAIVDPQLRRAYTNEFQQVRQAVGNAVSSGVGQ
jgi:esterase/lipase superfamily enzyme